jgi:hypothetical protein
MKRIFFSITALAGIAIGIYLFAADHVEAPAITGDLGKSYGDITDFYAYESPSNSDNYVFVCNTNGFLAPSATANAAFQPNYLYEIKIDNDGDNVEDLVIQCRVRNNMLKVYGPVAPNSGQAAKVSGTIARGGNITTATVSTYGSTINVGESNGIKVFAGPRDDPFFMDFNKFVEIVNGVGAALADSQNTGEFDPTRINPDTGNPFPAAFDSPGSDTFAGTNVMSIVVELPKSMLGSSDQFSTWVVSKVKS